MSLLSSLTPHGLLRWCCTGAAFFLLSGCSADASGPDFGEDEAPPPVPYPSKAPSDPSSEVGLALLNEYRAKAGLDNVTVDEGTPSTDCLAHLDYLLWENENNHKPLCFLSHTEDNHDNPFYSPEHETAGKNSVIACGMTQDGPQSLAQAVEGWMNSLYHRLPLLQPGLTKVGIAWKKGYSCINYRRGTSRVRVESPVLWPPQGAIDVPTTFVGYEFPCPTKPTNPLATNGYDCKSSGFIITASWFGHGNTWGTAFYGDKPTVRLLVDETNTPVELLAAYADRVEGMDPAPHHTTDTVTWVPAAPLPPSTMFRVEFEGTVDEQPTQLSWRFTTGTREH